MGGDINSTRRRLDYLTSQNCLFTCAPICDLILRLNFNEGELIEMRGRSGYREIKVKSRRGEMGRNGE